LKETDLYLFGKKNIKDCQVQAEESKIFPENKITECKNILCKITTQNNSVAKLKAPKAIINHETKSMFLPGIVSGSFKNWSIKKRDVFYNSSDQTINSKKTKISKDDQISMIASSGVIDLKNESILLQGDVLSQFKKTQKN